MTMVPKEFEGALDPKLPWWGGDWTTFADYTLRVELKADATKEEDLPQLGPRLATNLVGKAFESLGELDREALKKKDGWPYLLKHVEKTRGKTKVDLLGDAFSEFFIKRETFRKEGEEMNDFEARFRTTVRRMEKALQAVGAESKMPSEVYGWFLLNVFKLEPSDAANVRGKAESYKLEHVLSALNTMWSGGSLGLRDAEMRRRKRDGGSYVCEDYPDAEILQAQEDNWENEPDQNNNDDEEVLAWFQEARSALLEEAEDGEILANFREARKALDQARVSRGFYLVRNPNGARGDGRSKGSYKDRAPGSGKGSPDYSDKICMRCGKTGHIARTCPQRSGAGKGRGKEANAN